MSHPQWGEATRRLDVCRWQLEKQYRWARRSLRSLQFVERQGGKGTLAVDPFHRLYVNVDYVLGLNKPQLRGALWHEVNHILRRHDDRLGDYKDRLTANVAADMEINHDLRQQSMTLPDGLFYPETRNQMPGLAAESYYANMKAQQEEEQERKRQDQEKQPDNDGDEEDDADGDDHDDETGSPSPGQGDEDGGDSEGDDEGQGQGSQPGSADGVSTNEPPIPECGSGAGGDALEDELPAPSPDEQARLNREERAQAQDIIDEQEENGGGYSPVGPGPEVVRAARELIGTSEVDWRTKLGVELRATFEQVMDDAEEYTFRRPSRRAAAMGEDIILPSSFRPVPHLVLVADVSGSMDDEALDRSMVETKSVLEKLAIPEFLALGWDTELRAEVRVRTLEDVRKVYEKHGGGTDMVAAVAYAVAAGAELILILTDCEDSWDGLEQCPVPVVIGGIHRNPEYSKRLPSSVPIIDITDPK